MTKNKSFYLILSLLNIGKLDKKYMVGFSTIIDIWRERERDCPCAHYKMFDKECRY